MASYDFDDSSEAHSAGVRRVGADGYDVGDRVRDRDGFVGTVREVTHHEGSRWYDVQFGSGWAVRYDNDLSYA